MKQIILLLPILFTLCGCVTYNIDSVLLQQDEISLTWKGKDQIVYNEKNFQMGYNASKNEYRVYDDNISQWFVLTCSTRPANVGDVITADVSWTTVDNIKTVSDVEFSVKKIEENGKIWLWSTSDKIGIVVQEIQ